MTEFTHGIFSASKAINENNKGSILRTIIYTIGHFAIAITVLMLIADVSFAVALTDAIVEPLANAVWYFVLGLRSCPGRPSVVSGRQGAPE